MDTLYHAKLFRNGGSQAVRLPKGVRFQGQQEVLVRKEGRRVILEPKDEWAAEFVSCLGAWNEPIERPGPSVPGLRGRRGADGRARAGWRSVDGDRVADQA